MEAEEALSQGLDALNQSISDVIVSDSMITCPANMANYMGQMALAMGKLSTLEGFVRQVSTYMITLLLTNIPLNSNKLYIQIQIHKEGSGPDKQLLQSREVLLITYRDTICCNNRLLSTIIP